MSEGDVDRVAQVPSWGVGDDHGYNSGEHLKRTILAVGVASLELLKGVFKWNVEVCVAQQCSQSKACQRGKMDVKVWCPAHLQTGSGKERLTAVNSCPRHGCPVRNHWGILCAQVNGPSGRSLSPLHCNLSLYLIVQHVRNGRVHPNMLKSVRRICGRTLWWLWTHLPVSVVSILVRLCVSCGPTSMIAFSIDTRK